jgi:hypothetical protein
MRRRKFLLTLVCFGLPVVVLALLFYVIRRDEPPPDDADLRLTESDIPLQQNALYYFQRAVSALDREGEKPRGPLSQPAKAAKDFDDFWNNYEDLSWREAEAQWDAEACPLLLNVNRESRAYLARGLACSQARQIDPESYGADYSDLSKLLLLQAIASKGAGRYEEALGELLKVLRYQELVESCGLWVYHSRSQVLTLLRDLAADPAFNVQSLRACAAALKRYHLGDEAVVDHYRKDYTDYVENLQDRQDFGGAAFLSFILRHNFKPNATRRMIAEIVRAVIADVPKPPAARDPTFLEKAGEKLP